MISSEVLFPPTCNVHTRRDHLATTQQHTNICHNLLDMMHCTSFCPTLPSSFGFRTQYITLGSFRNHYTKWLIIPCTWSKRYDKHGYSKTWCPKVVEWARVRRHRHETKRCQSGDREGVGESEWSSINLCSEERKEWVGEHKDLNSNLVVFIYSVWGQNFGPILPYNLHPKVILIFNFIWRENN